MAFENLDAIDEGVDSRNGRQRRFPHQEVGKPVKILERAPGIDYLRHARALGAFTFLPRTFPEIYRCTSLIG